MKHVRNVIVELCARDGTGCRQLGVLLDGLSPAFKKRGPPLFQMRSERGKLLCRLRRVGHEVLTGPRRRQTTHIALRDPSPINFPR